MKYFRFLAMLLMVAVAMAFTACTTDSDSSDGGSAGAISVTFESAVQVDGVDGTAYSTSLTLTFDVEPTSLSVDDITVTGARKGELSGTGLTRTLGISHITVGNGETVTVEIANPAGFNIIDSTQTAVVYKDTTGTQVTFTDAVQVGGNSETDDSTGLTLTFDVDPT